MTQEDAAPQEKEMALLPGWKERLEKHRNETETETCVPRGTKVPIENANDRIAACQRAVQEALEHHRCRIVAFVREVEPVGTRGDRAMISTGLRIEAVE